MKSFLVEEMFIRFVSGEIDEDSQVLAGVFCAASDLLDKMDCTKFSKISGFSQYFKRPIVG